MKCSRKELVSHKKKKRVISWIYSACIKVDSEFCEIIDNAIESIVGIVKVIANRNANVSSFKCEYLSLH